MKTKQQLLIGVDIGTQGTKAALFTGQGKCLSTAFLKSHLHRPAPDVVEEDPETQLRSVCRTIRDCMKKARATPDQVIALGIDGQMAGIIGIDAKGRNVTPYDSWLDTRCTPYIKKMNALAEDEIIRKSGGPASFNHGPKILWWRTENPSVYNNIAAFVQPSGYAVMRLCGLNAEKAFIDASYLHFSGFADNGKKKWDAGLARAFKIDINKLPCICESHDVVGRLTPAMAARCGLTPDVQVIAGCGDTAASFLACGAVRPGVCVDVAGTASVFAATLSKFVPDTRFKLLSCSRAATPGLFHAYAYINGMGMNLEWFRSKIANGLVPGKTLSFEKLEKAALQVRLEPGLPFFVPHLGGRVSPAWPDIRGAWAGLTWAHGPEHLYASMLEGSALEYALYKEALTGSQTLERLKELRVTGGGEKNALWNQIKADALGLRVTTLNRSEGAPMGAALLAGFGVGLFKNLTQQAEKWVKPGNYFSANRKNRIYYEHRLQKQCSLLKAMHNWSLT